GSGSALRGREGKREDGAAALQAEERRLGRDPHQRKRATEQGLAELRQDVACADEDPAVHQAAAARAKPGDRTRPSRARVPPVRSDLRKGGEDVRLPQGGERLWTCPRRRSGERRRLWKALAGERVAAPRSSGTPRGEERRGDRRQCRAPESSHAALPQGGPAG